MGSKGTNSPIVKWAIDGVDQITGQDWYAIQTRVTLTGAVTVVGNTQHTLTCTVTGKNGASTGFQFLCLKMWIA